MIFELSRIFFLLFQVYLFFQSFFAALIWVTAISYCVLVLDEPLSLEPAANELEIRNIEKIKEIKILMYHQNKKHEYSTIDNKIFKKIDNILN